MPGRRLVFTDAYSGEWRPREGKPFMTAIITFKDEGGLGNKTTTRYTATVRHWTEEDKKTHEQMGFHAGGGQCADQLEALAKTI